MVGTVVKYGKVTIFNVLTNEFRQEGMRTADGADLLAHKFTISITGLCYGSADGKAPTVVGSSLADKVYSSGVLTFQQIMTILSLDRQNFKFTMGGVDLLDVTSSGDANNGPKVLSVQFTNVAHTTIRVQITFEITRTMCSIKNWTSQSVTGSGNQVISNRWSAISDIDDEWRETRTVTGQLRVSSSMGTAFGPNIFRDLVTPQLQNGFVRIGQHFQMTTDGLTLEYAITDKQQWAAPPAPAVKWSMRHVERTGEHAINTYSEIYVSLTGPPNVDKQWLRGTCCAIAFSKLNIKANTKSEDVKIITTVYTDHGHAGTIELMMVVQRWNTANSAKFFDLTMERFGTPLTVPAGYDPTKSPIPSAFGVFGMFGLFVCGLQTPCAPKNSQGIEDTAQADSQHAYPKTDPSGVVGDPPVSTGSGVAPVKPYPITSVGQPTYAPLIAAGVQSAGIYSDYAIDSVYIVDGRTVGLPVAGGEATDASTIVVKLARSGMRRIVTLEAKRSGNWPALPLPTDYVVDSSSNLIAKIDRFTPSFCAPELGNDGLSYVYTVRAEYEFTLSRVIPEDKPLLTGALPWSTATLVETAYKQSENYKTGMIQ